MNVSDSGFCSELVTALVREVGPETCCAIVVSKSFESTESRVRIKSSLTSCWISFSLSLRSCDVFCISSRVALLLPDITLTWATAWCKLLIVELVALPVLLRQLIFDIRIRRTRSETYSWQICNMVCRALFVRERTSSSLSTFCFLKGYLNLAQSSLALAALLFAKDIVGPLSSLTTVNKSFTAERHEVLHESIAFLVVGSPVGALDIATSSALRES